jgi:hypothetical protein
MKECDPQNHRNKKARGTLLPLATTLYSMKQSPPGREALTPSVCGLFVRRYKHEKCADHGWSLTRQGFLPSILDGKWGLMTCFSI